MQARVNSEQLETAVKEMYRRVALEPTAGFHFETGRDLAERLGYEPGRLNRIPAGAIESFAGVGYHFGLADLQQGESVLDLGSGSGTDAFTAATYVGEQGAVTGIDMTAAQREKALALKQGAEPGLRSVEFVEGYLEALPFADESFDCVISNGVINLVADKAQVFREAARVLSPGGRLALSDIVTGVQLPANVVCDVTLWAACIGGAMQRDEYQQAIESAGFDVALVQPNPNYQFLHGSATRAAARFEVSSLSLLAIKR